MEMNVNLRFSKEDLEALDSFVATFQALDGSPIQKAREAAISMILRDVLTGRNSQVYHQLIGMEEVGCFTTRPLDPLKLDNYYIKEREAK
jgi:hypothetical protein